MRAKLAQCYIEVQVMAVTVNYLILKWPRYYIFCNNSQAKTKFNMNLVVYEALITHIKNGGKASANCYIHDGQVIGIKVK